MVWELRSEVRTLVLQYNLNTPAYNASGRRTFHTKLCEASSVVEQRTGHKLHLLYNTTLTLTLSANARNNWLQKMVILVVRFCANLKTSTLSYEQYSQVKSPFQVLLFSTPLSLFIAGFLSSIANASRTFHSFIPVALSITHTLCQSMSCDPFLSRTCSAMANFSGWLSRLFRGEGAGGGFKWNSFCSFRWASANFCERPKSIHRRESIFLAMAHHQTVRLHQWLSSVR